MKQSCRVCNENPSRYKCPTCLIPFCSVTCNRIHKATPCSPPQRSQPLPPPRRAEEDPEEDTKLLTSEQLANLGAHEEVRRKARDPRLLALLVRIDVAKDRAAVLRKEMADPDFLEFCDDVLKALGVPEPPARAKAP